MLKNLQAQAGKAKVSQNALTHGLFAKQPVLADENPLEYQLLLEQLQQELSPVGILEQSLVVFSHFKNDGF